MLVEQNCQD